MPVGTVDSTLALGSALYARLASPLGSAFYDTLAPQGTLPPYTVYQVISARDDYSFTSNGEELEVMVKTVSNQRWPTDAKRIYSGTVHPYLQDAPLSMPGFTVLRCRRVGRDINYQDSEMFFHYGGTYRVTIRAT